MTDDGCDVQVRHGNRSDMAARRLRCRGDTLIEVLVALVIIMVGIMSLVGLQARIQQSEVEAYQRAQALILLQDMVARINANQASAGCYAITTSGGSPYYGTGVSGSSFSCSGYGDPTSQSRAVADMQDWNSMLKGESEVNGGGSAIGAMIGGRGCVTLTDSTNQIYLVAVAWQGLSDTVAPSVDCADNLYGSEARRRVVWMTFRLGNLAAS
jgi:type IV pilus assembly protein PilV